MRFMKQGPQDGYVVYYTETDRIAWETGLPYETIDTLLEYGWTFERINEGPPVFVMSIFTKPNSNSLETHVDDVRSTEDLKG